MAQTELAQISAAGAISMFTSLGAVLAQHGTSTLAVVLALSGAMLAAAELSPFRVRAFAGLVIFNSIIGVLGGAILADFLAEKGWLVHPLALGGCSFLAAWLGHDWMRPFKRQALAIILKMMERRK